MIDRKNIVHYIVFDWIAAMIVWLLFYVFRRVVNDMALFGDMPIFTPSFNFYLSMTLYPVMALGVHYLSGFYNRSRSRSRLLELLTTLITAVFISLLAYFSVMIDDVVTSYTFYYKSFLVLLVLQFSITYLFRLILTSRSYTHLRNGKTIIPVLVIGTGRMAQKVTYDLEHKLRKYGRSIVGYVKMDDEVVTNDFLVLGSMTQLDEIMQRQPIHSVIIAADTLEEPDLYAIINRLMKYDVDIQFPPRSFEILTGRVRLYDIDSTPVVTLTQPSMAAWQQSVKRVFDILMSLFALVLFLPIMVYVAVRVKRDSPGPIFYKQERIGKDGRPFYMYKFRTMYVGAEQNGPQLSSQNDERITPFGAIMRKYRLDELPQFWNILKGDMSVVGPRPERRYFINQIEEKAPYYCLIYKIQPGLLSWGPIKIGYSDTVEKMVERLNYDIIYMDNMTLLNDLKIMIYSLEVIIKGRGM